MALIFFLAESYSILCIHDFLVHSSVHFGYFHASAVVNAAAAHSCYFYLEKLRQSPWDTQSPFPSLSLAPTILFSVSREPTALGTFYEWTQTSFVLLYLAYVTEHNGLRLHPGCSLCWNTFLSCWTFMRSACPFFCGGNMEYLHSSLMSYNVCGTTSESPVTQSHSSLTTL